MVELNVQNVLQDCKTWGGTEIKQSPLSPLTCSGCHTPDCSIRCPSRGSEPLQDLGRDRGLLETGDPRCSSGIQTAGGRTPEERKGKKANEAHILKCQLLRGGKGARRRVALLYLLPGRRGVKGGLQPHLVRDDWLGLDLLHADRLVEERALVQG